MAKNLTLTEHIFDPVAPIVSTVSLNRLSAANQAAVRKAAGSAILAQRPKAASAAEAAMDQLKQNGVTTIQIDRAILADEVKPLWTSFGEQHPDAKPVIEAIVAARGQAG